MSKPQTTPTKSAPTPRGRIYLALAFIAPALIFGIVFALHGIFPFGDRQILVTDFWQQYYPFFSDYWHKIREGSSLLWSWSAGVGGNYLAIMAYYLASPLNLVVALFPHAWLREVLTVLLLLKIGMAGLSFALYLRYTHRRCDLALVIFALFYALCSFTLGYYWNIMWFDTFALLPLVMLGLRALVWEGKYRLYVVALALSVLFNYYIGFFTCIFVAIMFFVFCLSMGADRQLLLRRLGLVALCSVIGLGLTAVLTIPAFFALRNSYSAVNAFPSRLWLYENFGDILGNLIAFTPPNAKEGLPNLYCGMLSVLLAGAFVRSPKVPLREKLAYLAVFAFLIVSCNLNVLNYIWHGFHFTNMLNYRFSFLASFLLAAMAFRAYALVAGLRRGDLIAMAVSAAFVLALACIGPQETGAIVGSAALCVAYLLVFALYRNKRLRPGALNAVLLVLVLAEVSVTSYIGVKTVSTTSRDAYPDRYDEVQELLDMREDTGPDFYRTEFTGWYTINDSTLYGYNGASFFSSTANVNATYFLEGLGLPGWDAGNRYYYAETSPLTNAFLGMRYLISRYGDYADGGLYWDVVGESDGALLLENNRPLPLGFMVDDAAADYTRSDENPLLSQNELFRKATGLEGDLFTVIDMIHVGHQNYTVYRNGLGDYEYVAEDSTASGQLKWNYEMPGDGTLYAWCKVDNADTYQVSVGGSHLRSIEAKRPYLFCAGHFAEGELVSILTDLEAGFESGNALIYVGYLNRELFDQGYALLADEPLLLSEFSGDRLAGSVTALEDGLLYTSIPYEPGWRAFVDGAESEILPIDGCMAAIPLKAGAHTVELRYRSRGLTIGIAIAAASLIAFVVLIILSRRTGGRAADSKKNSGQQ